MVEFGGGVFGGLIKRVIEEFHLVARGVAVVIVIVVAAGVMVVRFCGLIGGVGIESFEVAFGVGFKFGDAHFAAEFDVLSLIVDNGGLAHAAEGVAGDKAGFEWVGFAGFFAGFGLVFFFLVAGGDNEREGKDDA